ncbi:MAG: hypothetical protein PHN80_17380 [Hespellia sp.]|nr:hypothetical protein [Hespellia sp.]
MRRGKMVLTCLVIGVTGILCGWYGRKLLDDQTIDFSLQKEGSENVEWESKKPEAAKSTLKNVKKCWLCGNDNRSMMGYLRKFDDLGIICVNDWYVMDFQIRNRDEEGNLIGSQGHSSMTTVGNGKEACFFQTNRNSDRGISEISVEPGKESVLNVTRIKSHLCQNCLDKVLETMETYGAVGEPAKPVDLCLVDFKTLELYPLQEQNRSYYIRDYYVRIEPKEQEVDVMAVYAPVQENAE